MCIYLHTAIYIYNMWITFGSGYSYMVPQVYQFLVLPFAETAVWGETSGLVSVTRETKKTPFHNGSSVQFEVWRMIKVYGMIILVMATDIDGCALAKSGWRPIGLFGKKGMVCKLISLTPRCTINVCNFNAIL